MFKNIFGVDDSSTIESKRKMEQLENNIKILNDELKDEMHRVIETLNGKYDISEKNLIHFSNYLNDFVFFVSEDFEICTVNKKAQDEFNLEKNEKCTFGSIFNIFENNDPSPEFIKNILQDQLSICYHDNHHDGNEENSPSLKITEDFEKTQFFVRTKNGVKPVYVSITMQKKENGEIYYVVILKDNSTLNYSKNNTNLNQVS